MKRSHVGKLTIAIVYVDDIIVKWDDYEEIKRLKKKLSKDFMIKDLRRLKCFLGIEMAHSRRDIFISYQKYILDLFKEISMLGCKPVDTPIEQNHELEKTWEHVVIECGMFQHLVGKLIYLSHTKPNTAYVVNIISQFMDSPRQYTGFYIT